jgi:membrane-bound lytic murein transglycosylase F
MKNCTHKSTVLILAAFLVGFISVMAGCAEKEASRLEQIWNAGKITFVTDNNAHCYYLYKDEPVGFEYELAKAFARFLVVNLQVVTPGWDEMASYLNSGRAEFIAASFTRTDAREENLDFSDDYLAVRQFIIVHKNNTKIKTIADLNGKTVHVRQGTSYQQQLQALKQEGIAINLTLHKNVPTEELIRRVAEKEIELTVADTNVALLNRRYYPDIRMAFPISPEQSLAWAVRKGDTGLVKEINKFLAIIVADGTF